MYMHHWGGPEAWNLGAGFAGHEWILFALVLAAPFILAAALWSVVWKALALWHAARRGQYWWFLILLVVNTLGILEIIYLFFVAKLHWKQLFSTHEPHNHH